jgi:hypothetical protein
MLTPLWDLLAPSEHALLRTPGPRSGLFTHWRSVLYPMHVSLAIEHAPFARLSTAGLAGCWKHVVFVCDVYCVLDVAPRAMSLAALLVVACSDHAACSSLAPGTCVCQCVWAVRMSCLMLDCLGFKSSGFVRAAFDHQPHQWMHYT